MPGSTVLINKSKDLEWYMGDSKMSGLMSYLDKHGLKMLNEVASSLDEKGLYKEANRVDQFARVLIAQSRLSRIKLIVDQLGGWSVIIKIIRELADNYLKKQETQRYRPQQVSQPISTQVQEQQESLFTQGPQGPSSFLARSLSAMQKEAVSRRSLIHMLISLILSMTGLSASQLYENPEEIIQSVRLKTEQGR